MGCGKTLTANFYPRPPRGGRPPRNRCRRRVNRISIHALREEGDLVLLGEQRVFTSISIHALREEGDLVGAAAGAAGGNFYPRPPRGGRHRGVHQAARPSAISIHALREEGDPHHRGRRPREAISIHALREEGDLTPRACAPASEISIHALREEGDRCPPSGCRS